MTSAPFKKGIIKFLKLFQQCKDTHKLANVFNNCESDYDAVAEKDNHLCLRLYGEPTTDTSLNTFQYPLLRNICIACQT